MRLERRQALWLPIVALHGMLLGALMQRPHATPPSAQGSLTVRLLPAQGLPRPAAPPARQQAPSKPPLRHAEPARTATPPPAPAVEPQQATDGLPVVTAPWPDTPAPAAPSPGALLQSEATRRAIRLATRTPLLSERAASASDAPDRETSQQRFGREVARSAYGNCLKGEFPGAGAGLLSLPMFLIAEASGRCQK